MPQIILFEYKPEFFKIKKTFYDVNRIFRKKLLDNYVNYSFIEVTDDTELIKNVSNTFGLPRDAVFDVSTTIFREDEILQVIYHHSNPNKFILFKRKINQEESYTFAEFKENENNRN